MVSCPSTPFSIRKTSVTNGAKLGLQVVRTLLIPLLECVFSSISPSGITLCLLHKGMGSTQPSTFPATALEQCGQGWVFIFLITPFSLWHPIALIWSLGHKDFGERWGKYAEVDLRRPLLPHQWQLPQGLLPLLSLSSSGWEERCFSLWCLKQVYFSLNTGNNQSPYHCCLFKPLNNLMLCLLLVPIRLSPGLCGENTFKCSLIFLALFSP